MSADLILPISKTKRIIKASSQLSQVTVKSAAAIAFVAEYVARFIFEEAVKDADKHKKKMVAYENVYNVVHTTPGLAFLNETVPPKFPLPK